MSSNFENHREKKAKKLAEKRAARAAEKAEKAAKQPITFGPEIKGTPILSPGDAIPARWNFYKDGRIWVQKSDRFKTNLGPADVYLGTNGPNSLGGYTPYKVENCLFPDGTRGTAFAGYKSGEDPPVAKASGGRAL